MTAWEETGSRVSILHSPPREQGRYRDEEKQGKMRGEQKETGAASCLYKVLIFENIFFVNIGFMNVSFFLRPHLASPWEAMCVC